MAKYRKKPVVIEAWQNVQPPSEVRPQWLMDAIERGEVVLHTPKPHPIFTIKTLEGAMTAGVCDWIIRGVKGEVYPCKPDIFEATYDAA
jgi:hypothetical protein